MQINAANWVGENTATVGNGDITLGGAIDGFARFNVMGDGQVYYCIQDGLAKETGVGTLTGNVLSRTTINATIDKNGIYSTTPSPLLLSGNAQVFGIINAEFMTLMYNNFDTVQASATSSAASAAAALVSQNAAKVSETNSKTSETNSATSAAAALVSQNAAKASETNSKTSETNSKTSETNSSAAAAAASASQTAAKTSETNAGAAAVSASASESNAGMSATNAKASENASKASETNAANSAASAGSSATNAAASASSAHGSQVAASTSEANAAASATSAKADADRAQTANPDNQLKKTNNLSDVADAATSRLNLGLARFLEQSSQTLVYAPDSQTAMSLTNDKFGFFRVSDGAQLAMPITGGGTGANDAAGARTNLGVDKLSQQSNGTFLQSPNTLHSLFLYNGGEWGCIDSVTAAPRVLGIPFGGTSGLMSIYDTIATFISAPTNKDLNLFVRDSSTAGKLWGCFDVSTQTHIPLGIGQGGTGKSTAAEARVALNAVGVGDYGVGTSSSNNYAPGVGCGFYGLADNDVPTPGIGCTAVHLQTLGYAIDIASPLAGPSRIFTRNQQSSSWSEHYCTANTTVDVNGFIKKASPIVKLKGDGTAVLNEYAEGVTVKRISIGVYKISGVLGFNSSTEWGGVNGGYSIPQNGNGLPLIWLDYEVQPDGDLIIKTYHREHINVPEFARNHIEGINDGGPVDIPEGRWVDLRVEMPFVEVKGDSDERTVS